MPRLSWQPGLLANRKSEAASASDRRVCTVPVVPHSFISSLAARLPQFWKTTVWSFLSLHGSGWYHAEVLALDGPWHILQASKQSRPTRHVTKRAHSHGLRSVAHMMGPLARFSVKGRSHIAALCSAKHGHAGPNQSKAEQKIKSRAALELQLRFQA